MCMRPHDVSLSMTSEMQKMFVPELFLHNFCVDVTNEDNEFWNWSSIVWKCCSQQLQNGLQRCWQTHTVKVLPLSACFCYWQALTTWPHRETTIQVEKCWCYPLKLSIGINRLLYARTTVGLYLSWKMEKKVNFPVVITSNNLFPAFPALYKNKKPGHNSHICRLLA